MSLSNTLTNKTKKITLVNQLQPQYTTADLAANDFITCTADSDWWTGYIGGWRYQLFW